MAKFQRTVVTFRSQLLLPYITRFSWSPGVLYGEAPLRGPTTSLLYAIFNRKGTLSHTFYWRMVPFHIPCLQLCISFNCCKCNVFKIWINHKTRTFSRLIHNHRMHRSALLGIFTDPDDRFPQPFIYFSQWNPFPFIYLKPEKGTLFGWSLPKRSI